MKTLILGNKGMLGADLQIAFKDYEVLGWDREELDITNGRLVLEKITQFKPNIIINAAAYNAVDAAEENEEIAYSVNGYAIGYLAKLCRKNDILLIHYSTNYVFDGKNKDGYTENDEPNPQSVYAASKALGERLLKENTNKFYLIRTARIFGDSAISDLAKRSFVQVMIELASTQKEIRVVNEEYSNATYSKDLAQRTREILEWKKPFGIYHVTNDGVCTWYDFAKEIFGIKKLSVKLTPVSQKEFPRPATRPNHSVLINTKLPSLRKWEEALKQYLLLKNNLNS